MTSSESSLDDAMTLVRGRVLGGGKYRLVSRIGRGGFGDVWDAEELLPDGAKLRDVALKILSPTVDQGHWSEEAKLLASFSHPSLVTIYAAGILEGLGAPFVAMELLVGRTLAEELSLNGRLPWRRSLAALREVAQALDVIHARGVVHLDLKPANIFLTNEGAIKLLDFGISRTRSGKGVSIPVGLALDATMPVSELATAAFLAERGALEGSTEAVTAEKGRVVVGTPGYVAPEVLQLGEPTMLADAYALGVTLAVLATGSLPHRTTGEPAAIASGDELRTYFMELRDATLRGEFRTLSAFGLPNGVVALIQRLCAVDPERRRVEEGGLRRVFDEIWERPHGVPDPLYPGLLPFGPEHEGFVFGRDQELLRMVRHLSFEGVLSVAGARASGKTSFVRSILVPRLERVPFDARTSTEVIFVDKTSMEELEPRLCAVAGVSAGEDVLAGFFNRAADPSGPAWVVVIDDFDAIRSLSPSARAWIIGFVQATLARGRPNGFRLIIVIAEEQLESLIESEHELASLPSIARYLAAPAEVSAAEIGIEAARVAGWEIEDEELIVGAVSEELARGGVPLPWVGVVLASAIEWTAGMPSTRRVGLPFAVKEPAPALAPKLVGSMIERKAAVVHRHADGSLPRFGHLAEKALDLMVHLTTSDGTPLKASVPVLEDKLGETNLSSLLERLREHALVRLRGLEVELGHPALATWPKLVSKRLGAMDSIALVERISESASAWERGGMRRELLDDGRLLQAIERVNVPLRGLSGTEVEFLTASRRLRRRRAFLKFGVAASLIGVFIIGVIYRERLEHRRLLAEAAERAADQEAKRVGLLARSRQSTDPYARVAFLTEAIALGASEPATYLELVSASQNLPPGRFLSLEPIDAPEVPWNDRWVIGRTLRGGIAVFDLESPEPEDRVIEHDDLELQGGQLRHSVRRLDVLGTAPVVEVVPMAFDTAFATLGTDGTVSLYRLRESGEVALAAFAPMQCRGELAIAKRAPVLACVSRDAVALWNFRTGETWNADTPRSAFTISDDGAWLTTWHEREVEVSPTFRREAPIVFRLPEEVLVASMAPHEHVLAIKSRTHLSAFALSDPEKPLIELESHAEAVSLEWAPDGLSIAVCKLSGVDRTFSLIETERESPFQGRCDGAFDDAPYFAPSRFFLGAFGLRDFGDHFSNGAFRLSHNRWLSTSLVMSAEADESLEQVVRFARTDAPPSAHPESDGFAEVVRVGLSAAIQLARTGEDVLARTDPEIVIVDAQSGRREGATRGYLLEACPRGRIAAFRPKGELFEVFDARGLGIIGTAPRGRSHVLAISSDCGRLLVQELDGTFVFHDLEGKTEPRPIGRAEGYVSRVKRSTLGSQWIWLALSSGELVRIDEAAEELRLFARAEPRAFGLADGQVPGELYFVDRRGVHHLTPAGSLVDLGGEKVGATWSDLHLIGQGRGLLLASNDEASVFDLTSRTMGARMPVKGMTQINPWGEDRVLLFGPAVEGLSHGLVLPFGGELPKKIGTFSSNLRVTPKGELTLTR